MTECIQTLLVELKTLVRDAPGQAVDGTPAEIVESVLRRSARFYKFSDGAIQNLHRQLVMAVNHRGAAHNLRARQLSMGRVEISYA